MDYITNRIFIIYYGGIAVILFAFVYIVYFHFKDDDHIDLREHFGIILLYVFLLITAIYLWGIITDFINTMIVKIEIYKKTMEIKVG